MNIAEYEALFVIDPGKESSIKEITTGINGVITKTGGNVTKEENWGKQRLAYPVKKSPEGIYYKLDFSADTSKIAELNNSFKLNTDILRVMITAKREK